MSKTLYIRKNTLISIRNVAIVVLLYVLLSRCFNFFYWTTTVGPRLTLIFYFLCFIFLLLKFKNITKVQDYNNRFLAPLILLPLASAFANFFWGSDTTIYGANLNISAIFLSYYFIRYMKISEKEIMLALSIVGLITLGIQIYQQAPHQIPVFGIRDAEFKGEQRNGFFRFSVGSVMLPVLCSYYYFSKCLKKISVQHIILCITFAACMYLFLTRQVIIACASTFIIAIAIAKNMKSRIAVVFLICVTAFILGIYFDAIFGNFISDYQNDTHTTDVRRNAIPFILERSFDNPLFLLIGHSRDAIVEDNYAKMQIFLSDIGFIGQMYIYGIIWVCIFFKMLHSFLFKHKNQIPFYCRLFCISACFHSIFYFPYGGSAGSFIWVLMMYLCGLKINKKDELVE